MEIDSFFEDIDCLIVPPLWPEAFGRTVSESYLRGVPVLGSKLAGVAEQIGDDQEDWLFQPGNVEFAKQRSPRLLDRQHDAMIDIAFKLHAREVGQFDQHLGQGVMSASHLPLLGS